MGTPLNDVKGGDSVGAGRTLHQWGRGVLWKNEAGPVDPRALRSHHSEWTGAQKQKPDKPANSSGLTEKLKQHRTTSVTG